jgi:aminoglycoside phosphotransferase (APT) family kinase protein
LPKLTAGLKSVLGTDSAKGNPITVVKRKRNIFASTFPSEVVTCRLADGTERQLFCKYWAGRPDSEDSHRRGVAYEAEVYQRILRHLPVSLPGFYGTVSRRNSDNLWLVLEHVDRSYRLDLAPDNCAMIAAAAWAGRFHDLTQDLSEETTSFLQVYDADYYAGWSRRTWAQAKGRLPRNHWLEAICRRYEDEIVPVLTQGPPAIIHGEYTPNNVLWRDGQIFPVDWESAAVGAAEIDLAVLLIAWDRRTSRACEQSYRKALRRGAAVADFDSRVDAARMYVTFRWLADAPEGSSPGGGQWPWYLKELRRIADRLEFI